MSKQVKSDNKRSLRTPLGHIQIPGERFHPNWKLRQLGSVSDLHRTMEEQVSETCARYEGLTQRCGNSDNRTVMRQNRFNT